MRNNALFSRNISHQISNFFFHISNLFQSEISQTSELFSFLYPNFSRINSNGFTGDIFAKNNAQFTVLHSSNGITTLTGRCYECASYVVMLKVFSDTFKNNSVISWRRYVQLAFSSK